MARPEFRVRGHFVPADAHRLLRRQERPRSEFVSVFRNRFYLDIGLGVDELDLLLSNHLSERRDVAFFRGLRYHIRGIDLGELQVPAVDVDADDVVRSTRHSY